MSQYLEKIRSLFCIELNPFPFFATRFALDNNNNGLRLQQKNQKQIIKLTF